MARNRVEAPQDKKKVSDLLAVRCRVWWNCTTVPRRVKKSQNSMAFGVALPYIRESASGPHCGHMYTVHTLSSYFSVPTVCCHGQYRGTGDRFLAAQDVSLFPTCLWPTKPFHLVRNGVRLPGRESDYWLSSHCKVKNAWGCTCTPCAPL